jgi:hypothetical protein
MRDHLVIAVFVGARLRPYCLFFTSVEKVVRMVLLMSKASCAAWCWIRGQSAIAWMWVSTSCVQLGQAGSICVPSACASPLLCLSYLVSGKIVY